MVARTTFVKLVFAVLALFAVSQAHAQNELRNTFFKEADAAKAAAAIPPSGKYQANCGSSSIVCHIRWTAANTPDGIS